MMLPARPLAAQPPALLLAAGRGLRMRPLTDSCPKPLLKVQGKPLLQWHLEALLSAGVVQAVINTAWLEDQLQSAFGPRFGTLGSADLRLCYSREGRDFGAALETAGGVCRALPLLFARPSMSDVFWLVSSDIFAPQFVFAAEAVARFRASDDLAHVWLVPNPMHHPQGDFALDANSGTVLNLPNAKAGASYSYSGIGLYRSALFGPPWCDIAPGNPRGVKAPLAPLLRQAAAKQKISAEIYTGNWVDVGTPQRLALLNQMSTGSV